MSPRDESALHAASAACRTVRLDVRYRGTAFRGFAANAGVRTVAGELSAALEQVLGESPALTVAGRTDAGVHATGQVVSFRLSGEALRRATRAERRSNPNTDGDAHDAPDAATSCSAERCAVRAGELGGRCRLDRLAGSLNRLLQPEIAVTTASFVDDGFDARRSAVARAYEYRVRNATHPDPRYCDLEWHIAAPLDLGQMNAAAACFVGEHDFTSFCRRPKGCLDASLVRNVTRAIWTAQGARLLFEIEANAFCHQMVRAIVGQCVAAGRGTSAASDVPAVLTARNRNAAAPIAPPHGLTLVAVRYPDTTP
ncbi:tRNA pseudouridine(38-40) synthase TruA [Candidatus Poriferisodalis sp.]|uniref:tRNA pseudouridine(38-40) synthase TruA n=1 Tax=Candidatus Poriferisodalis sp. TaxID=3101277 RepID=UPI003B0261C5